MTLLSAFGGGLWIIPLGLLLAAAWSFYRSYLSHNSNSTRSDRDKGIIDNTGNVPYTQIGSFWFGVILVVAFIVAVIWMANER